MSEDSLNKQKYITFDDIALALANDYESVYVIDSDDDSYVEYMPEGDNKELVVRSSGANFYEDVPVNARALVHSEDQENFINAFKKETVNEVLTNGESFSLNYKLLKDGKPYYYFLKTIKGSDHNIIVGVQNVDDQVRRAQAADRERITYQHIAGALASRYEAIYYVNIKDDTYIQYSVSAEYAKLGISNEGSDFFKGVVADTKKYVHIEDRKMILAEMDKNTLLSRLKLSGTVTLTYRQRLGDADQYVTMRIVHPMNDEDHIVIGVTNVDAEIRHEEEMLRESALFNEVALALASRYEAIYRVNIITNEYSEYSASPEYTKLEVGNEGKDFFEDTKRNMKRDIYHEDYEMMSQAMDKENILRRLTGLNKIFLNYRLNLDGRPQYVSLVIIRTQEDAEHIIVAVENIDEAKKKEMEFEAAIGTAIDMANRDALTGVKNKHAYVNAEFTLDNDIGAGICEEFAIAICDINGLKEVNDHQGHVAGDDFIRNACQIICEIFDHSPVFRIGGDEFAVILKGIDYKNRHDLYKKFALRQRDNARDGLVTLAFGMSEYIPESDLRVQDVFERADVLMYENKRRFKGKISDDEDVIAEESYSFVRFYELYERLLSAFVTFDEPDVPLIEDLLIRISTMFRLSKGITRVYKNPQEEREGKGETLCCFDTHKEGNEILSVRVVTSVMSSAQMTIYMSPDEVPLSAEEMQKMELVVRTVLSFVSRNRLKDIVYELAYYDEVGFPNLRFWNQSMIESLKSGQVANKAYFRYNLRHFSLVNQEFGRVVGDKVLRSHFKALESIIGEGGCLTRLGGDNFIGYCAKDKISKVADYIAETAVDIDEMNTVKISCSAGIFVAPEEFVPRDPGELMGNLTNAFVMAQSGGKDHIIYFDESITKNKERGMRVQQLFPDALRNGEFRPFYQPKVNVVTGQLIGAEALCRWFHKGKIVPPIEFIPFLEKTSDICKLDVYMLEQVCKDMRRWIDSGLEPVRVSVNFSRKHTMNPNLAGAIAAVADKYDIPHDLIEIELTETTTDVEFNDIKRIALGLREQGFYLSIDDFGVGYSSLNLIREIPWNTIKIDRSYLPEEGEADDKQCNVKSILFSHVVSIANQLGVECITEGVETKEQVEILKQTHCELAQGYFYDKPLPVGDFEERLKNKSYGV